VRKERKEDIEVQVREVDGYEVFSRRLPLREQIALGKNCVKKGSGLRQQPQNIPLSCNKEMSYCKFELRFPVGIGIKVCRKPESVF